MRATAVAAADEAAGARPAGRRPRIGIVGAGQLARMTAQAALDLDVAVTVLARDDREPALAAGARPILGPPDSLAALRRLAALSDVVTFDHELVPSAHLAELEASGVRLAPSAAAKLMAQDKARQREALAARGLPVPEHRLVRSEAELDAFGAEHGWPVVAKAPRGGYDGRGVMVLDGPGAASPGDGDVLLVERHVAIACELAVLVARSADGSAAAYPVVETIQVDGMCRELLMPARIDPALASRASSLALDVAATIGATGILAVELFVEDGRLLVNELALRPHNSGHATIEACTTSQFANHVRAVLGWPLGVTGLVAPAAAMVNVVGPADPRAGLPAALAVPGAHVHLYGKAPRPGRKLGHVTALGPTHDEALAVARAAAAHLEEDR